MTAVQWSYFDFEKREIFESACILMQDLIKRTVPLPEALELLHHPEKSKRLAATAALSHREDLLGTATVSAEAIVLLSKIARHMFGIRLEEHIVVHAPSLSASRKVEIVQHSVQKTISLTFRDTVLLCTSYSDFMLTDHDKLKIAGHLRLANPKRFLKTSINPKSIDPNESFGLTYGMVSSFLSPERRFDVTAIVLLSGDPNPELGGVALSASLLESIILPLGPGQFKELVKEYLRQAQPDMQVIDLDN